MVERRRVWSTAWDAYRAGRGGLPAVLARQERRFGELLEFARARSRLYAERRDGPVRGLTDRQEFPPVTKSELMERFDDWVTDPAVTRAGVAAFVADRERAGELYRGRYTVWTTSGITGVPGIFLVDPGARAVYWALLGARGILPFIRPQLLWEVRRRGGRRVADVLAAPGHFVGPVSRELHRKFRPWLSDRSRSFFAQMPLPELVRALNEFDPTTIFSYPTLMSVLAEEQVAGRLRVNPISVTTGAEALTPAIREQITRAFRCLVIDHYGAAEFMTIALSCDQGWLHVNADWVILEPVDEGYRPVPPGRASHTVLLTNLANRVQPLIRYDLGDSITVNPDPCPCGNPLPAIHVEGRRNEILTYRAADGRLVRLPPQVLLHVVQDAPGVRRFQLIQTGPTALSVRLEPVAGADGRTVWEAVAHRLKEYLEAQGLPQIEVERASDPPRSDPVSGKFPRIWREAREQVGEAPESAAGHG